MNALLARVERLALGLTTALAIVAGLVPGGGLRAVGGVRGGRRFGRGELLGDQARRHRHRRRDPATEPDGAAGERRQRTGRLDVAARREAS